MLEHLKPLFDLLDKYNVPYEIAYSDNPGNIIYKDDCQMGVIDYDYNSVSLPCHFCATAMAKDLTLQQVFFFICVSPKLNMPLKRVKINPDFSLDFSDYIVKKDPKNDII